MALPSYVVGKGTAQDCIDHMRRTHKLPLSVKAANLAKYFPVWTVSRVEWSKMLMPCVSGVAIDMLVVQPRRLASLSPLPVDQPYRKSHGVPGYVPKVSVVIQRGKGFSGKTPGPPWA